MVDYGGQWEGLYGIVLGNWDNNIMLSNRMCVYVWGGVGIAAFGFNQEKMFKFSCANKYCWR